MKKTFRSILAGALALLAVSCYDDSALKSAIASLESRVTELENKLNTDVSTLNSKIEGLEAAYKLADKTLTDQLTGLNTELTTALNTLTQRLDALDGSLDGYVAVADYTADKTALTQAITELLAADKSLTDAFTTALAALREADSSLQQKDAEILAALVGVGVTNVSKNADGNVVITFVDKSTLEIPTKPQEGLVTVLEVDGENYWAVVVNGEKQSLGVKVGHPSLEFEVDYETNELLYSVDGGEFEGTGAYVSADQEYLLTDFYQGEEFDYDLWEDVVDDYYTLVFGGVEYQLPLYKVDNSVVTIRKGKTYFEYAETITVDLTIADITSIYVMSKPDGWRAKLADKKLTVTAPFEANIEAGIAEADGEVLLHCTTAEGKCKIAKLAVATTPGFSLTVDEDGNITIINPEVNFPETSGELDEEVEGEFNDAYIGIAQLAGFDADPIAYVQNAENIEWGSADKWTYINNWKMNDLEYDENGAPILSIGGFYKPGTYEVDVIKSTVSDLYASMSYGKELPAGPCVVWACPLNESGLPRIEDLVYTYYYPTVKATITEVSKTTTDVSVKVNGVGSTHYYVGLVSESMLYGFPVDQFMQMQEGPFGYFQMAINWGAADYAFQQMGAEFGGESGLEMPETINASDLNYGMPLMPNSKLYMWVFPVVDGLDLGDYTYEKNMKPYIYEFTTKGLLPGGSANVEFSGEDKQFTSISVGITATEGAALVYYKWYTVDAFNALDDEALVDDILSTGMAQEGEAATARVSNNRETPVAPGSEYFLAALAVDAEGKYGEVNSKLYKSREIIFSETFVATFGQEVSSVFSTGFKYDFPISVEGGTAAKYYYVLHTQEYTDEELANLPLTYNYTSKFQSTTTGVSENMLKGQFLYPETTYYLAVVVESATGEFSPVIKKTIVVPAQPSAE